MISEYECLDTQYTVVSVINIYLLFNIVTRAYSWARGTYITFVLNCTVCRWSETVSNFITDFHEALTSAWQATGTTLSIA